MPSVVTVNFRTVFIVRIDLPFTFKVVLTETPLSQTKISVKM